MAPPAAAAKKKQKQAVTKEGKKKKSVLVVPFLLLVAAALGLLLAYDGNGEDDLKATPGGYDELLINIDQRVEGANELMMLSKMLPNWESLPWEDRHVKELPRSEFNSTMRNATRPIAIHLFLRDSDMHRFEFKRLWSRAARDFRNVTGGKEVDFYAMEVPREGHQMSAEDKEWLNFWKRDAGINLMPLSTNYVLIPVGKEGGNPAFARKIPLKDSGPQLIKDLDDMTQSTFKHLTGEDAAQVEHVFKQSERQSQFDNADCYLFAFVEQYDQFEGPAKILEGILEYDWKKYQVYQTTNMSLAPYVNAGEEVKVGDTVMYRYEDGKGFVLPQSLKTAADVEAFTKEHTLEWGLVYREDLLSGAAIEMIERRAIEEDQKLRFTIVYDDTNEKNIIRMRKVAEKIMREFRGHGAIFPILLLAPKSYFGLHDKMYMTPEDGENTQSMINFAYYKCRRLSGTKIRLLAKDVASLYTIDEIHQQINLVSEALEDLDDAHDPFAVPILEADMDYYDNDDEDGLLEMKHDEL